jgi:hypothetical protein
VTRASLASLPWRRGSYACSCRLAWPIWPCEPARVNPANPSDQGTALRQVSQVIERLLHDGTVVARSDGTVHGLFPVAVGAAEGVALRQWIVREHPVQTIEIGLGYGISALFICEGLLSNGDTAASHVVVDPTRQPGLATVGSRSWRTLAWPGW